MPSSEASAANPANIAPDSSTRVRRPVVIRLIAFLIPVLLAWLGLEVWLTHVPTSHSLKHENLTRLAPEIDTLVLGASGAYFDIAPAYLPGSAFNLANVAQTPYYDDQLATQWLPKLPHLRRLIIQVNYVSMFFQLHGTDEEARQYYYYQEWGIPPPRLRERLDVRMWSGAALRTPLNAVTSLKHALADYRQTGHLQPPAVDPPVDSRGWCPQVGSDPNELSAAVVANKINYHHGIMHVSEEPANFASLEHLVSLARSRGIEVILVTPPVWPGYAAQMRPEYWNRAQADFNRLGEQYGARYLSFLSAPMTAADFHDADHLNEQGAITFSRLLAQAVGNPQPAR